MVSRMEAEKVKLCCCFGSDLGVGSDKFVSPPRVCLP